jgi:hypothetical protein
MRTSPEDHPWVTTSPDVLGRKHQARSQIVKSSIKRNIFSNVIDSHTKTTLGVRQVKYHVCSDLTRRVPTICVFLSTLCLERVSNFAVYMLLLQSATITEQIYES